jgi:endonuclease/exonuclease/phosphatase family metal-dependent hydrolase
MRISRTALAALVLFLSGTPWTAVAREAASGPALWAMSYNIRYDNPEDRPDWRTRRVAMVDQIRFYDPDILGLQEALPAMVTELAAALPGYAHYGVGRDDGAGAGETTTIFYRADRFTLLNRQTFWCSPTPERPGKAYDAALSRTFTRLVLQDRASGRLLDVRNAHLDHVGAESRLRCAQQIRDLAAWPGAQLIAMGDFNSGPEEPPLQALTAEGSPYRDARSAARSVFAAGGTFNGFTPRATGAPIDFILVDRRMTVGRFAVPADLADGAVISDHFPVLAELWPAQEPGR